MTVFTRTKSGIGNYSKFFGAEFVVFTEGKMADFADANGSDPEYEPTDAHFYKALLSTVAKGKVAQIKCIGNKDAALEYAKKIEEGTIKNAIVIADRDLEGILSSPLPSGSLVLTFGYSWENELWSPFTLSSILGQLTNENKGALKELNHLLSLMAPRMRLISALDAASQVCGCSLLQKRKSFGGIALNFSSWNPLPRSEVARLILKYKTSAAHVCPVSSLVLHSTRSMDQRRITQGHIWSNIWRRLLAHLYRKVNNDTAPSNQALLNLALSVLRQNVTRVLGKDVIAYYQAELRRVGVLA